METRLFVATKAFIVRDGKVLVLRESSTYTDGTNVAKYDLPGGRLTPGEAFNDALTREVQEETGLSVVVGAPITVREWRPQVRGELWQIVGIFFACKDEGGEVVLGSDHDAYEWIDPAAHASFALIDNLHPVFEQYINSLHPHA